MKGKEVKIGLSIIGVLLCVFGVVLFDRLRRREESPPVAAKSGEKAGQKKENASKAAGKVKSPDASSKAGQGSKGRPSLKFDGSSKQNSPTFSSRNTRESETRDPWATRSPAPHDGGRYQDRQQEQEERGADRYGRGDRLGDDRSPPDESNSPFPLELNESASESEASDIPDGEASDATADSGDGGPAFETASDPYGAQPADGYRTAEEPADDAIAAEERLTDDAMPVEAADDKPFSMPSHGRGANRGLPIGDPLKSSPADVQLTPIEQTEDEPLQASHAAEIAEATARDRDLAQRLGARPARSDFSSASRKSAVALEQAEPMEAAEAADDAGGSFRQADENLAALGGAQEGVYFVEVNDSFATIAKKVYGNEGYFKALYEYNRERYPNPSQIDAGDEIATPDVAVLEQNYPKLCPKRRNPPAATRDAGMRLASSAAAARRGGRTYLVREGDTLFDIAKRQLGKATRWREIYDLNQDQLGEDFNYLSPGMELALPGGDRPDPVADRRSQNSRR